MTDRNLVTAYTRLLTAEHMLDGAAKAAFGTVFQHNIERALFIVRMEKAAMLEAQADAETT